MGTIRFNVRLVGLRELRRKVDNAEELLLAEPWRDAMRELGQLGAGRARAEAPVGLSGRTRSMVYHHEQRRPMPLWSRVGTRARAVSRNYPRGYPYPRRTNFDMRSPHFGWLTRAIESVYRLAGPILDRAARQIEKRWSS